MPELAAKIRAKYPGLYDDLTDAELEAKVLSKYPAYADLRTPEEPAQEDIRSFPTGTTTALVATKGIPNSLGRISQAAGWVAESPAAQKAIGALGSGAIGYGAMPSLGHVGGVIGSAISLGTGGPSTVVKALAEKARDGAHNAAVMLGKEGFLTPAERAAENTAAAAFREIPRNPVSPQLARTVGKISRGANLAGLLFDAIQTPGDIPWNETPEKQKARQAEFERRYQEMIREDLLKKLGGDSRTADIELQ